MCFGVRDAIALARSRSGHEPITILGELVHNDHVLGALRAEGVQIAASLDEVRTRTAMITAHGASEATLRKVRAQGLNVIEATCPLVHFAHRAVAQLVAAGYHPVIVGKPYHVEVRGITEDLREYDVILNEEDIAKIKERPRFGVASQTTQPIERVRRLVALLRGRFPASEVRFVDTVCQPTKQRQAAAIELAGQCDVVIVVGGAKSNNTRELVQTCSLYCDCVHHVEIPGDIRAEWFAPNSTVGITAGTSTPDTLIDQVEERVRRCALRAA